MIESLSIAVNAFVSRVSMSFSVDETLLESNSDYKSTATCNPHSDHSDEKKKKEKNAWIYL